jgi:hypothetical protein
MILTVICEVQPIGEIWIWERHGSERVRFIVRAAARQRMHWSWK